LPYRFERRKFGLAQLAQLGAGFSYFRGFCIA
jgi:hypothetical protein